ncbi:FGLLP motif-containing membrane protein [Nocardioides dilutus]
MVNWIRTALGTTLGVLLVILLGATSSASGSGAADDDAVLQGTWTIVYETQEVVPTIGDASGTVTYRFGEGCSTAAGCMVSVHKDEGEPGELELSPGGQGLVFTEEEALDCFDTVTGELTTEHGADYAATGRLALTKTSVRDGVTYVSAMAGTYVQTITLTAAGHAANCTIGDQDVDQLTQRSTITGTPVALPPIEPTTSSDPVSVDPTTAGVSGTLPEFLLPHSDTAEESAAAVDAGRRSSVPGALTTPADALDSLGNRLPQAALLAAVLGLLIVFPAAIFNSTYEENRDRIDRALRRPRRPVPAAPQSRPRRLGVFLLCTVVGALLGGLLDEDLGANTPSYALLTGIFVALLVAVAVVALTGWLFRTVRHQPHEWFLRAVPGALVVAVLCVVVSRLTHFEPGYLFGILGGAVFAASLERRTAGRAEFATLVAVLLVSLGAWVAFGQVVDRANADDASFGILALDALLACLFIGGIEGLLFSLVPLRFLPGHRVRQWGLIPWLALTAVVAFVFVHVLLIPEAGYLGRSTSATATLTVVLFGAFGLASLVFWAWFRFRPDPAQQQAPTTAVPA